MTINEARELMNGEDVVSDGMRGEVEMPRRQTGWFKVRWESGTVTVHEIAAPHSVAKLERVKQDAGANIGPPVVRCPECWGIGGSVEYRHEYGDCRTCHGRETVPAPQEARE
jgi:hypothetical protein